jgi:hypothetical protein
MGVVHLFKGEAHPMSTLPRSSTPRAFVHARASFVIAAWGGLISIGLFPIAGQAAGAVSSPAGVVMPAGGGSLLGSASTFAILAGSDVTVTGLTTTIVGDVGVSPGTSITGVPLGQPTGGSIHSNDAVAIAAQSDLANAFAGLTGMKCTTSLTGQDLGTLILSPGIYCFASSAQLTGTVTLNGAGLYVFQIGSTITSASDAIVNLTNGAEAQNVYWQIGSSATIGVGTAFAGNIVALTSITMMTDTSLNGRALAMNGAVTFDPGATPTLSRSWGRVKGQYHR